MMLAFLIFDIQFACGNKSHGKKSIAHYGTHKAFTAMFELTH